MTNGRTKQRNQGGVDKVSYNINRKFVATRFASKSILFVVQHSNSEFFLQTLALLGLLKFVSGISHR